MKQRVAIGTLSLAVALVLVLFWPQGTAPSLSAMERMAQSIRQARSYRLTMTTRIEAPSDAGRASTESGMSGKLYWLAPGSYRMETKGQISGSEQNSVMIFPHGQPGIDIDHTRKRYRRRPARQGHVSPFMVLDELSKFTGQADRALGTRQIEGKTARGFEIAAKKIDPDSFSGPVQIWIDADSNLPLLVRYEMKLVQAPSPAVMQMEQFEWNVDLDASVFETSPPSGYADATPKPPTVEQQVDRMVVALQAYAEVCGGHYPRVKMVYGDVTRDDMLQKAGIEGSPTPEQMRSEAYAKVIKASRGFATLNEILRDNPAAEYHGRSVGPSDKNKILLRWQLPDDRFQVIYGDLRTETVSATRLEELEGR